MPQDMKKYLQNYNYHFNHKLYKFAVSKMYKKDSNDKMVKIEPVEKEKVQEILKKHGITLENDEMYDSTYLYSMAMADYIGTAFDEATTAKWIKATIDDVDKPNGFIFNRFYADMCFAGIPIDWEEFI
jgi:monomeric isocitrate dehydrogenase